MQNINGLIRSIKASETLDKAFIHLDEILQVCGLKNYMFTHMGIQDSPAIFKIHYHKTTYPSAWMQIYRERRYLYVDPVAKRVMSNDTPFFWSEYVSQIDPSEESLGMMATLSPMILPPRTTCAREALARPASSR